MICTGQIVDIHNRRIYPGHLEYGESGIKALIPDAHVTGPFILPGFIDAHVHIESSLCTPPEFARAVLAHGVTSVVTDPHEIANVLGLEGIRFMLDAAKYGSLTMYVMASSCVPATLN